MQVTVACPLALGLGRAVVVCGPVDCLQRGRDLLCDIKNRAFQRFAEVAPAGEDLIEPKWEEGDDGRQTGSSACGAEPKIVAMVGRAKWRCRPGTVRCSLSDTNRGPRRPTPFLPACLELACTQEAKDLLYVWMTDLGQARSHSQPDDMVAQNGLCPRASFIF
jgi:hypothetical protein